MVLPTWRLPTSQQPQDDQLQNENQMQAVADSVGKYIPDNTESHCLSELRLGLDRTEHRRQYPSGRVYRNSRHTPTAFEKIRAKSLSCEGLPICLPSASKIS
jgi:hypothetical protein